LDGSVQHPLPKRALCLILLAVRSTEYDATIIGSGPNGLAAAIELARAGLSVCVFERNATIGGGMRSQELTLPGFVHDICSAIHPLGMGSPFFQGLRLSDFGLEWIQPDAPIAHPLPDGRAVLAERSLAETSQQLGVDAEPYQKLFSDLVRDWKLWGPEILGPVHIPAHPLLLARFSRLALRSARAIVDANFRGESARALFAGAAGHSVLPLDAVASAAIGLVMLTLAHAVGWPLPKGGSQKIANALAAYLGTLGGRIVTAAPINSLKDLPSSRIVMCDVTPRQLLQIAGGVLADGYQRRIRSYRYGPGVFKVDWALSSAVPWKDTGCRRAGTVHLGGTFEAIATSERDVSKGRHPEKPYVILVQPSLFDSSRAPSGKHTCWAYCHVPNGSTLDMTERIEAQIESVAPGFKDCVLARHTMNPAQFESHNPNYVGGDIAGGLTNLWQIVARPVLALSPYRTPVKGLYICSSSTPPGGGVHGMCGYHAARTALGDLGKL
jgi:phytoene dehydrogenase-like protein